MIEDNALSLPEDELNLWLKLHMSSGAAEIVLEMRRRNLITNPKGTHQCPSTQDPI